MVKFMLTYVLLWIIMKINLNNYAQNKYIFRTKQYDDFSIFPIKAPNYEVCWFRNDLFVFKNTYVLLMNITYIWIETSSDF